MSAQMNRCSSRFKLKPDSENQNESNSTYSPIDDKNKLETEEPTKMINTINEEEQEPRYEYKLEPLGRSHPSLSSKHEHFKRIKQMVRFKPNESLANNENQSPEDAKLKRYQALICLVVCNQSKEEVGLKIFEKLKQLPLTIDNVLSSSDSLIESLIYPINFYKRKVTYIRSISEILKDYYNYDIPNSIDLLCTLPGVGPKIANLTMTRAINNSVGIAVDSHVMRVANRLGWSKRKDPMEVKKDLEDWIPFCCWGDVNPILNKFGKSKCTIIEPKCYACLCKNSCPKNEVNLI